MKFLSYSLFFLTLSGCFAYAMEDNQEAHETTKRSSESSNKRARDEEVLNRYCPCRPCRDEYFFENGDDVVNHIMEYHRMGEHLVCPVTRCHYRHRLARNLQNFLRHIAVHTGEEYVEEAFKKQEMSESPESARVLEMLDTIEAHIKIKNFLNYLRNFAERYEISVSFNSENPAVANKSGEKKESASTAERISPMDSTPEKEESELDKID